MKTGDALTRVVILGSTGSIGRSTLNVIEHDCGKRLRTWGLSAHTSGSALIEQARTFRPRFVTVTDPESAEPVQRALRGLDVEVLQGLEGVVRMVQDPATDRVLSAIVGAAGLEGTWAALEAGKTVALANKETLVVAGPLVMELARSRGASLLPVDSEHSAIFQALQAGSHAEVKRVILTSSGGPFRGKTRARAHRRDRGRCAQAPDLADGAKNHDRLGHPHEQGTRSHRSAVAVRT